MVRGYVPVAARSAPAECPLGGGTVAHDVRAGTPAAGGVLFVGFLLLSISAAWCLAVPSG
jgi:hypothetical protein